MVSLRAAAMALVDHIGANAKDSEDDVSATIDTTSEAYQELLAALDLVL